MGKRTDFLNDEVYPLLFDKIDMAFPDMDFKSCALGWITNKKLDGTKRPRKDKCFISKQLPSRIKEQGGESIGLIDFQMRRTGQSFEEALKAFCDVVGLEMPNFDTAEYKAYKERQDRIVNLQNKLQGNLKKIEAEGVVRYLYDERGYNDALIETMGLGFVDDEARREIENIFGPIKDASSYVLSIPYISGGKVLGFKFRRMDGIMPKYKNTKGLPKQSNLFGLTGLKLTGNNEKDRDITIVEGELDALHAQAIGMENIVAAAGGEISEESLEKAKIRGVKRVTILFDREETEQKQKETLLKIKKAITKIHACGLKSFVATFPEEEGIKIDTDSFLRTHSKEDLEKIIMEANTGAIFAFNSIIEDCYDTDIDTFKKYDDFKDRTISLMNSPISSPSDRMFIARHFAEVTGEPLSEQVLREEADELLFRRNAKEQEAKTIQTAQDALALAQSGQIREAIDLMAGRCSELTILGQESKYIDLLALPNESELKDYMSNTPQSIETEYQFASKRGDKELFDLPSGAITFICALPSHGKSTMLQNIALQVASNGDDGCILYFSFEEDKHNVILQMMNKYMNYSFSSKNLNSISFYYRNNSDPQMIIKNERALFERKKTEFIEKMYHSGKIRIYGEDFDSKELIEAVKYISKNIKVKAVFIDYIQLLKKRGCKLQRTEELKDICIDFKDMAVSTGLPVIAAAQLNREARSPWEMCNQNIAEAADLERIANKIICLWNCTFEPRYTKGENKKALEDFETEYDVTLGKDSKIFAKVTKNRSGINGITAVLDFNGNTGHISPNKDKEKDSTEEEEESGTVVYSRHGDYKRTLPF